MYGSRIDNVTKIFFLALNLTNLHLLFSFFASKLLLTKYLIEVPNDNCALANTFIHLESYIETVNQHLPNDCTGVFPFSLVQSSNFGFK
jgi:hypothetical protein